MKLKYDNITISGGIGVGTTTLLNNLRPYLEPVGFRCQSMGQFVRDYLKEYKHPLALDVPDSMDREIEQGVLDRIKNEKNWAIEAWLAGFMARGLDNVLKVLVVCSVDSVRVDRVVNRENISVDEAKTLLKEREQTNLDKWKRLYGDHDFWDPAEYDIIVDTYSSGPLETTGKILDKLGYKRKT